VAVSPDGWEEAIIGKTAVTFVDRRTGYDRTTASLGYPLSHAYTLTPATMPQFSPDGRYLVAMAAG
jgi:hypothetical protein